MGVTKEIVTTGAGDTGVVVDATFPIPDDCAPRDVAERHREEMRVLARRICNDMDALVEMVKVAVRDKHHLSLGYGENGWVRYITHTFDSQGANLARGDRRDLIKHLAMLRDDQGRGMSSSAIAKITGMSKSAVHTERASIEQTEPRAKMPREGVVSLGVTRTVSPDSAPERSPIPETIRRLIAQTNSNARRYEKKAAEHPDLTDALVQAAMEAWTILDDFIEKYDNTSKGK